MTNRPAMANVSNTPQLPVEELDDSDWEYEYHKTETESFYVSVDLTSNSNHLIATLDAPSKNTNPGTAKPSDPPTATEPTTRTRSPESSSTDDDDTPGPSTPTPGASSTIKKSKDSSSTPEPTHSNSEQPTRLQILDLHGSNPLISYGSRVYSCEWTSTLGTDMLFAAHDPERQAVRPIGSIDLLAATRIKLMGKPVQVLPRRDSPALTTSLEAPGSTNKATTQTDRTGASANPVQDPDSPSSTSVGAPRIPLGHAPSLERRNQARFLERMMAIKRAKGETDTVPVYVTKQPPKEQRRNRNRNRNRTPGVGGDDENDGRDGDGGNDDDSDDDDDQDENKEDDDEMTGRIYRQGLADVGSGDRGSERGTRGSGRARGRKRRGGGGTVFLGNHRIGRNDDSRASNSASPQTRVGGSSRFYEVEAGNDGSAQGFGDWRQRLTEHLHGSGAVVVDVNDTSRDQDVDVEMDDA